MFLLSLFLIGPFGVWAEPNKNRNTLLDSSRPYQEDSLDSKSYQKPESEEFEKPIPLKEIPSKPRLIENTTEPFSQKDFFKNLSIELKSLLLLRKNELLTQPYQWSVSNPYTEFTWNQKFKDKSLFELGLELAYKNQNWDYSISSFFFEHLFSFRIPLSLQWGYFNIFYIEDKDLLLSKKPLVEQILFPNGEEAPGLSLNINLDTGWSFILGLRANDYQKASLNLKTSNKKAIFSVHTIYKKDNKRFFTGYFHQDLAETGPMHSIGLGGQLKRAYQFYLLQLKTEAWNIQTKTSQSFVWYLFPYIKILKRVGLGWFFSSFQEQTGSQSAQQFESVAKFDFYLKDSTHFSIENIQEYSSVYSHNSWNFSLKTHFIHPF